MKEYTQEDLENISASHSLDVDSTIVVRFKTIDGQKTSQIEKWWKLSDIIEKLEKL